MNGGTSIPGMAIMLLFVTVFIPCLWSTPPFSAYIGCFSPQEPALPWRSVLTYTYFWGWECLEFYLNCPSISFRRGDDKKGLGQSAFLVLLKINILYLKLSLPRVTVGEKNSVTGRSGWLSAEYWFDSWQRRHDILQSVQTSHGAHLASYSVDTRRPCSGGKAAGAWSSLHLYLVPG